MTGLLDSELSWESVRVRNVRGMGKALAHTGGDGGRGKERHRKLRPKPERRREAQNREEKGGRTTLPRTVTGSEANPEAAAARSPLCCALQALGQDVSSK